MVLRYHRMPPIISSPRTVIHARLTLSDTVLSTMFLLLDESAPNVKPAKIDIYLMTYFKHFVLPYICYSVIGNIFNDKKTAHSQSIYF